MKRKYYSDLTHEHVQKALKVVVAEGKECGIPLSNEALTILKEDLEKLATIHHTHYLHEKIVREFRKHLVAVLCIPASEAATIQELSLSCLYERLGLVA